MSSTHFYSRSTGGFYDSRIVDKDSMPADCVSVSTEYYLQLLVDQSSGKAISSDAAGRPVSIYYEKIASISSCTPAQGLVALYAIKGITEDNINEAIDLISDDVEKYKVKIAFKRAVAWDRESNSMMALAVLLNLSDEDLDDLFEYAVTVQV